MYKGCYMVAPSTPWWWREQSYSSRYTFIWGDQRILMIKLFVGTISDIWGRGFLQIKGCYTVAPSTPWWWWWYNFRYLMLLQLASHSLSVSLFLSFNFDLTTACESLKWSSFNYSACGHVTLFSLSIYFLIEK